MYPSYNKTRSQSTTDLSRSFQDAHPPHLSYATLSRRQKPASNSPVKRTKSYLTDGVRREYEVEYMSTSVPSFVSPMQLIRQHKQQQSEQQQSPLPTYGTNNFVKRLVATLERKQQGPMVCTEEVIPKRRPCEYSVPVLPRLPPPPPPPPVRRAETRSREQSLGDRFGSGQAFNREQNLGDRFRSGPAFNREQSLEDRFGSEQALNRDQSLGDRFRSGQTFNRDQTLGHRFRNGQTFNRDQTLGDRFGSEQALNRDQSLGDRFRSGQTFNRFTPNRLTKLNERDDEEDDYSTDEEEDFSDFSRGDSPDCYWHDINLQPSPVPSSPSPEPDSTGKPGSAKRVLKSMFTSLMNWRNKSKSNASTNNANLPRGTRDYYAARPSLGEEMQAFRSGTMTRLYERSKSRDVPIPEERILNPFPEEEEEMHQEKKKTSVATIRPIYGSYSAKSENRHCDEAVPLTSYSSSFSRKFIQPAALPAHRSRSSSPTMESLMRPTKVIRDLHKRSSRGESTTSSVCSSSSTSSSLVHLRCKNGSVSSTETVYDIPRTRPILPSQPPAVVNYETIQLQPNKRYSQPDYENFMETIYDDRRLQCSAFTTF